MLYLFNAADFGMFLPTAPPAHASLRQASSLMLIWIEARALPSGVRRQIEGNMGLLVEELLGIAVVDDDPLMLELVEGMISAATKFSVFKASDGEGLNLLLAREHIDCIVLDYNLGTDNGFAVLQRANERFARVPPVVMLTGVGSEATVVKALRMGIDDFVIKRTMNPGELIAALVRAIEGDRREAAQRAEFERLKAASALDLVTGALGRAQLEERVAALASLEPAARARHALILVEFVELKGVREKLGLKAGDKALREFATRLRQTIRSNDVCGRHGDNTLLVIADVNGDPAVATSLAGRIAAQVATTVEFDGGSAPLSARIGAAIAPAGAASPDEVFAPALEALKAAAEQGVAFVLSAAVVEPTPEVAVDARVQTFGDPLRTVDRRRAWRKRVFKRGQIIVPGVNTSINCMVRNLSATGAGLRIDTVFAVPEDFELTIFGSPERRKVRVRWQTGVDLGVEFMDKA